MTRRGCPRINATTATSSAPGTRILSMVCAGHFVSHFLTLTLPPLFPFLGDDFGLGFTELGLIMTLYASATGVTQIPMGFLVDRVGAFPVMLTGLAVLCLSIGGIGLTTSPLALGGLAVLAGAANSVFHPANYSILAAAMNPARMGRAFGLHTFAGYFGNAVAPVVIVALAVTWGWRVAVVAAGSMGLAVVAALLMAGPSEASDTVGDLPAAGGGEPDDDGEERDESGPLALFVSPPVMKLFLFFVLTAATSSGMQTFSVTALVMLFDTPLVAASAALTAFLFAMSMGILGGGVLADRTRRHDLMAALAFAATAAIIAFVGTVSLPTAALILLFAVAGLLQGIIRPARDMLVHAASPEGATGRVFGFVTTGINVGGALTPLLLGWLVDQGAVRWVFWFIALAMVLALATVMSAGRSAPQAAEGA